MRFSSLAAALLVSAAVAAHADSVSTYNLQNQAGTQDIGSLTIDSTTGSIQGISLPLSLGAASVTFSGAPATQAFSPYTNEYIATFADAGDTLQFNLPVSSLIGYVPTDSAACSTEVQYCDFLANVYVGAVNSADLTETFEGNLATGTGASVTPEPGSIALLGTGLLGLCGMVRRRRA